MPFEVPTPTFSHNAEEHATNKVLRSNQLEVTILEQFKAAYEDFWGVSGSESTNEVDGVQVTTFVSGGSRYSVSEMQSILDVLGDTAIQILAAAAGLVEFIDISYPGVLADRYKWAAFDYTVEPSGLTLSELTTEWAVPPAETPPE
jgi:hypothetical protein